MDAPLLVATARSLAAATADAASAGSLDIALPPETNPAGPPQTVREALQGAAFDLAWVPDVLAGRREGEAAPAQRGTDLLGADPAGAVAALVEAAVAAVGAHADPGSTTHLSYGDLPARDYLRDITGYYGLLTLDINRTASTQPSPEVVQGLWDHLGPVADDWREIGVIGPRVEVADDAPLLDRLRGLTGRRP